MEYNKVCYKCGNEKTSDSFTSSNGKTYHICLRCNKKKALHDMIVNPKARPIRYK